MKKFISLLFILCSIISCKKDRTCTCITTVNGTQTTSGSFVIKHITKNKALERSCVNTTQTVTTAGASTVTATSCKLEK